MHGLMLDFALTTVHLFERAERLWSASEVVTASAAGSHRCTYGEWTARARRLAGVLDVLGISDSGRVATFAWNDYRHLELSLAVPSAGRVLHPLDIDADPAQLAQVIRHAEDEAIFVSRSLLARLWPLVDAPELRKVWHLVVMDDGAGDVPDDNRILDYEDLLLEAEPVELRVSDEHRAAGISYTADGGGQARGVVRSHRSTVLQSLALMGADTLGVSRRDTLLAAGPLARGEAWSLLNAGVAAGSRLVLPGVDPSPARLVELIEQERVTLAAGAAGTWAGLLLPAAGHDLSALRGVVAAGPVAPDTVEVVEAGLGAPVLSVWGTGETSGVAAVHDLPLPLVEARVVAADTHRELPWDGETAGDLQLRGPWMAREYHEEHRGRAALTDDGWLRTGRRATVSPDGRIRLTPPDRR
ncbi:MAG TPA: AMP-binding protein [Acidimicrobiales bacterium]|nr:AMP-binding protein [Acidimicrobiales bacterium]